MDQNSYFQGLSKLSTFGTFVFREERISLMGTLRVFDEGVREIRVELIGHVPMYGEWQPVFAANGNDFHVKIISFGYGDAFNVGNEHPKAKQSFTQSEIIRIKYLIHNLFNNSDISKDVPPFTSMKARYLSVIEFRDHWITELMT